jgi:hypothetical protein
MTHSILRPTLVAVGICALLASSIAEAQWVMLARHVVGRVEQMSQQAQTVNGPSYDTAVVMLEAPADKVFATAVAAVRKAPGIRITNEDAAARLVQFTNETQIAGLKVTALGDNLSHILVSSAHTGPQPDAAAMITQNILRVCQEMRVECSRAPQ